MEVGGEGGRIKDDLGQCVRGMWGLEDEMGVIEGWRVINVVR